MAKKTAKKTVEFHWTPWIDFGLHKIEALPIDRPPCEHCEHWYPRRDFDRHGTFQGIVACSTKGEMHNDFSCFESKREQKKD